MHRRRDLPPEAIELARHQSGVLSRAQLLGPGVSRNRLDRLSDGWVRLACGIYSIGVDLGEPPWPARVWAGILLGGPGARACGLTAAVLDGLAAVDEDASGRRVPSARPSPVHILVPARHLGPHPGFTFTREKREIRQPSTSREPPRTRIEDTTLDLCAAGDQEAAVTWLTRACQRRLTTPNRLRRRTVHRPNLRHRALLLDILDDVETGVTSQLEYRAVHEVFRPHDLPDVRLQHRTGSGRHIAYAAIVAYRVLIEFDGRLGHVAEGAFRDRTRDNQHTLDGWVTLRFGWSDVSADPCAVAEQIARLLELRGWNGPFLPCLRCRAA